MTLVVEPEHADPWLRRFGRERMTWCLVRDLPGGSEDAPGSAAAEDGDLETLVHAWLTRSAAAGSGWVARLSGPSEGVARSIERPRHDGVRTDPGPAQAGGPAHATLATAVVGGDLHLLVRRAWHHGLTFALLRGEERGCAEVVAALERGDDAGALAGADRVLVCQPEALRCSLGALDPGDAAAPAGAPRSSRSISHRPHLPRRRVALVAAAGLAVAAAGAVALALRPSSTGRTVAGSPAIPAAGVATASSSASATSGVEALPPGTPSGAPAAAPAPVPTALTGPPPARTGEAVAFDGARNAGVLFGGSNAESPALGDTWLLEGTAWRRVSPRSSPPARTGAAAVYNPTTGHVVLVGGVSARGAALDDTWVWDGATWSPVATRTRPAAGAPVGLVFDEAAAALVLVTRPPQGGPAQTWTFTPGAWRLSDGSGPAVSPAAAVAYDASLRAVVLVDADRGVTALWDGSRWTRAAAPPTVSGPVRLADDTADDQLVLVGVGGAPWTFDGAAWHEAVTAAGPVGIAALLPTADGLLAVGGPGDGSGLGEEWRWSADGWTG